MPEQSNNMPSNWLEFAKSFGAPFAMCCAMMLGFWGIMQQMRSDHQAEKASHVKEVEAYQVEQKADKTKLIELSVQGNTALDKVGDGIEDVGKGLEELKDQGEKLEYAVNKLTDVVNDVADDNARQQDRDSNRANNQ